MIKSGVRVGGIRPEMVLAYLIAAPILVKHGQEAVITSCTDGKHSKTSRHYIGCAIDLRTRDMDDVTADKAALAIANALGGEYYVAFEKNHIHLQFNSSAD